MWRGPVQRMWNRLGKKATSKKSSKRTVVRMETVLLERVVVAEVEDP